MCVLMKFADDINLRPGATTDNDWNTSWKELDESAEREATCNLIEEMQSCALSRNSF